jgi:2-haloacid dehalogenase
VLSVGPARAYKPSPKAYALLEPALGLPPGEVLFVSSNGLEMAGAKRFGFQVTWARRGGGPGSTPANAGPSDIFKAQRLHAERLDAPAPDYVVHGLTDLAALEPFPS